MGKTNSAVQGWRYAGDKNTTNEAQVKEVSDGSKVNSIHIPSKSDEPNAYM